MIDVAIIGGGVIGCSTARELSRFELDILVLEKSSDICDGQSKANTGIIHAGYDAEPGSNKAKFNVLGNAMFDQVCAELDVPHKWNTSLVVSFNENDDNKLSSLFERGQKNGVKNMRIIDREEIFKREPNISRAAYKALLLETGGIVCPYELTIANAENAAMNGAKFLRNTPVTDIKKIDGGWRVFCGEKHFDARAVINCAGAFSDEINNMVSQEKHHIRARRGEYYIVDKKYENTFNATIFQLPDDMGKGVVITPTVEATILVGPTSEDIDDKTDKSTTRAGLEKAFRKGSVTWENIPKRAFITTFSGLRAHCDKDDFVIGEAPDAPLFFNALGIESPGIASSPAIAKYLADIVSEKLNARPNKKFNPERKSVPKFREMSDDEKIRAIAANPEYAKIVCRCETITEAEVRACIRHPVGARTVDGVKLRTRAGMGRCQAGFCTSRTIEIMCEELRISPLEVTKSGAGSELLIGYLFGGERDA